MATKEQKRILVTGAAGFTGHHMVAEAVKAGYFVRATDVSSRYYGAMFDALGVEFVASDLTRAEGLDRLCEGMDAVVHVAGIHDYSTPDKVIFAVNTTAVENICQAAVKAGVNRFVHLSSVGVYGYSGYNGRPVIEDDPKLTPPLNNYNISKWEGEKIVRRYIDDHRLNATIFRPAAIYGTRCEYGLYNAFKEVYAARNRKKMLMAGKGDKIEAFLHVEDMCRAVVYALENEALIGEAYNVSDDTRITTAEFFRLVCRELLGTEKDFLHLPLGLLIPLARAAQFFARHFKFKSPLEKGTLEYLNSHRVWGNAKLKATGFAFKHPTMEKGMAQTLAWYKQNGWFRI